MEGSVAGTGAGFTGNPMRGLEPPSVAGEPRPIVRFSLARSITVNATRHATVYRFLTVEDMSPGRTRDELMEDVPTTMLAAERCHLGEGPL